MPRPRSLQKQDGLHVPQPLHGLLATMTAIAICVDAGSIALIAISGFQTGGHLWLVIGLVLLAIGAAQQETLFGDETALSASMIIVLAAVGSFIGGAPLWLVALCGLLGGLSWEHLRDGQLRKVAVNTACTTIAAFVAVGVVICIQMLGVPKTAEVVAGSLGAALAYWIVDNGLVAVVLTAVDGRPLLSQLRDLTRSETLLVPCASAGFLMGNVIEHGFVAAWIGIATLVALVAASRVVVMLQKASVARALAAILPVGILTASLGLAVLLGVHAGLAVDEALPGATLAFVLALAVERFRPGRGPMVAIVAAVLGATVFTGAATVAAPLVFVLAAGFGVSTVRRAVLAVAGALSAGALAVAATMSVMPARSVGSFGGSVATGVALAFAYLVTTHLVFAVSLYRRAGNSAWLAVASLIYADSGPFLLCGLAVAGGAWIVRQGGLIGAAPVAVATAVALAMHAAAKHSNESLDRLSDEQLVDVARSAILELPASRLPADP